VPPAAVDEERNLEFRPSEIRFPNNRPLRSIASEMVSAQQFFHALFGTSVAARTHRRHDL